MNMMAPINPGSIPSVGPIGGVSNANRTSIGGGISPINFTSSNVVSHFLIGTHYE
jgi:hypothetical protein